MPPRHDLFGTTARGTEELLAQELTELGAQKVRQDRGGVRFAANLNEALRIALWTRIAMRLLWPLGEYEAKGAPGLYEASSQVPWEEHLTERSTFAVEATLKGSEHTHSGFVALKVKDAIVDRLRQKLGSRPDVDTKNPNVRIVAHLAKDRLSLALDLVGEPLNRRGYRVQPTVAPLKETLAAAILRAVGYTGEEPVVDPMCGSGTLLIEAGLIAVRRAPNLHRKLAVESWPRLGDEVRPLLEELRAEARRHERKIDFQLYGFDKNPDAIAAAKRNVKVARLSNEIVLASGDATQPLALPEGLRGLLVSNPPYGERLAAGGQKGMKTFYFKLGENLPRHAGLRMAFVCGNPGFESAFHQRPTLKRKVWNGPIECDLLQYGAPSAERAVPHAD